MEDLESRVAAVEQRCRSDGRRLDKLEQEQAVIHSLAASLQVMAAEQKHQTEDIHLVREDVGRLSGKVDALEMKPARRWEGLSEKVLLALAGGVAAWLLAQLGL